MQNNVSRKITNAKKSIMGINSMINLTGASHIMVIAKKEPEMKKKYISINKKTNSIKESEYNEGMLGSYLYW